MFQTLDAVLLARLQFAFTMSFHIVFPAFTIGLASFLAVLETLWLATGREVFHNLFKYWIRVFAVAFGMGVVSGIVMSYQFGTNWSVFSERAGPVIGPLMAFNVGLYLTFAYTMLEAANAITAGYLVSEVARLSGFAPRRARRLPVIQVSKG